MSTNLIHYLPVITTVVAVGFFRVLRTHWRRNLSARYVMWWMIGVGFYGLGTLTEALTTIFGWNEPVFRTWYIAGALLGAGPLAQGTVYLLLPRRIADRLAVAMVTYVAVAAAFVVATPLLYELVEPNRLSGEVMAWQWVRLFSPLVNLYAVVFLIGGSYGLPQELSKKADLRLSLSSMTLPHRLARLFLAEQIYQIGRASCRVRV